MAELTFPWQAFLEAANARNQNRQQMYQDIAGLGQGLGQGIGAVGETIAKRKQEQQLKALIDQLMKGQGGQPQTPFPQGQSQMNTPLGGQAPSAMGIGAGPLSMTPPAPQAAAPQGLPPQGSGVDPVMQMILPFVKNNPDLLPQVLPALAKGAYLSQRPRKGMEMTDYQTRMAGLRERQITDMEKYQSSRQQLSELEASLRDKGLTQQAQRIRAIIADMDAKHPMMYGLGLMQSPGEAAGIESSGGTDDSGWGDVTVSP